MSHHSIPKKGKAKPIAQSPRVRLPGRFVQATIRDRGAKKSPCCLVARANPAHSPAPKGVALVASSIEATTKATNIGSVKAVGAKRTLIGNTAIREAPIMATLGL